MNKTQELKERIYAHNPELRAYCSLSQRVDGKKHTEVFDGDDPYTKCVYCGEVKSATSGMVIVKGSSELPDIHLEHVLRAVIESVGYRTRLELLIETPPIVTQRKEGVFRSGQYIIKLLEQYDLTKTFDQNCENQELVDFLLEVIK